MLAATYHYPILDFFLTMLANSLYSLIWPPYNPKVA